MYRCFLDFSGNFANLLKDSSMNVKYILLLTMLGMVSASHASTRENFDKKKNLRMLYLIFHDHFPASGAA